MWVVAWIENGKGKVQEFTTKTAAIMYLIGLESLGQKPSLHWRD